MNRGIAKRTLFETERDIRFFLSRLAKAVRAGRIEIHCFCILTTHFHLLGKGTSYAGELCARHLKRLESDESYAQHAARILAAAIHAQHGKGSFEEPRDERRTE